MTFLLRMITAAVLFFSLAAAAPAAVVQADSVRVLPISGDIDGSQAAFIQRGLRQAAEEGDTAVVITINTLGGHVDSALKIRDMLMASDVPTIAYVTSRAWSAGALIALSCRHIIMAPGSSIGAAEPIPNTEKNIAALKAEFSATAAQNGHNPGVAEAMVDKSQGYPDYAEPGKILALSDGQARELNVSDGSADTLSEALALYSLGDARLTYVDKDWRDDAVGILQNPYVRTVFVALIIAALLAEIKMAGIGAGIATAFVFGGLLLLSGNESLADGLKSSPPSWSVCSASAWNWRRLASASLAWPASSSCSAACSSCWEPRMRPSTSWPAGRSWPSYCSISSASICPRAGFLKN